MQTIRWAMIGHGSVTEQKSAPAFQQTEGFELAAVVGRDLARVQAYAQRKGIAQASTDVAAVLADPNIHAVYIATPPSSHCALALQVAAAGKHCCVEKPMALNLVEAQAMVAAFERANKSLFVAHYRRSLPRFAQVKRWIDQGRIGAVRHVRWQLSRVPKAADSAVGNWRLQPDISGGGYFMDLAPHGLDLLIHWCGPAHQVGGAAVNQARSYAADDAVAAYWVHANGATGVGSWHFNAHRRVDELLIEGSTGEIRCAVFDDAPLVLSTHGASDELLTIDNPSAIQLPHVQAMRAHWRGELQHPATGEQALHVVAMMASIALQKI
jgi:1,5-anhydro-D-fructose reductase (1,5-anhydro-D-mannitol-forming)